MIAPGRQLGRGAVYLGGFWGGIVKQAVEALRVILGKQEGNEALVVMGTSWCTYGCSIDISRDVDHMAERRRSCKFCSIWK